MTTEEVDAAEYQHVVIFLHGVGGSGSEWKRFLQKILPPRTKLILPSAPVAPVDLFFGREMSSWYNMYDSYTSNILEVKRMAELFHQLIQDEVDKGVRPECIVLGGFSQGEWCVPVYCLASCDLSLHPAGGALALYVSLTAHLNLGGTFVLSSYLLAPWELQDKSITRNNSNSPILICHGLEDVKVPVPWALHCHSLVSTLNTKCKLKKYVGLGHDVNSAVQHDVQIFLTNILCHSP